MRIAIMQPYFIPYAGYFRLFQSVDLFVVYDCVQFTRRGWIHRNKLPNHSGELSWLTLPLQKAPQEVKISELQFAPDASERMQEQSTKFPLLKAPEFYSSELGQTLSRFFTDPVSYMIESLRIICTMLHIPFNIEKSSALNIPNEIRGQERIITIAKYFNADIYVNAPGGRDLYEVNTFEKNNIQLNFLSDYIGSKESILSRLYTENIFDLRTEIAAQSFVN